MEWDLWVVFFFGCCCCCWCCCCCSELLYGECLAWVCSLLQLGKSSISFRSLAILPRLSQDWRLLPRTYVKSVDLTILVCRVSCCNPNNSFHEKISKEKYPCSMRIPLTHPKYQNLSLHTTSTPLSYQTKVSPSGSSKVFLGFLFAWATISALPEEDDVKASQ